MFTLRKITVSIATLFLGLAGMFLTTGTATGDCDWNLQQCQMAN